MTLDRPKSDTLHTRLLLTSTFRAARSRWTYPMSERYLIPAAMPRSIPTNWMTVNWPSCFWKKKENQTSWPREVKDINLAQLQHEIFFFFPTCRHYVISAFLFALKFVLTLRNSSNEPFSMYSMTIMTGFPGGEIKAGTIKRDMINWYLFCFPPKVHITTK